MCLTSGCLAILPVRRSLLGFGDFGPPPNLVNCIRVIGTWLAKEFRDFCRFPAAGSKFRTHRNLRFWLNLRHPYDCANYICVLPIRTLKINFEVKTNSCTIQMLYK